MRISSDLELWMLRYDWPGNIRELRNLCAYLSVRAWGKPEIGVEDLPPELRPGSKDANVDEMSSFERDELEFQRKKIFAALKQSRGNISSAARLLRMSRNTVSLHMRRFGYTRETFRD